MGTSIPLPRNARERRSTASSAGRRSRLPVAKRPHNASTVAAPQTALSNTASVSRSHPPKDQRYVCSVCGKEFGLADVYDLAGSVICMGCYQVQSSQEEAEPQYATSDAAVAESSPWTQSSYKPKPLPTKMQPPYLMWIVAGSIAAVVLIVVVIIGSFSSHHSDVSTTLTPTPKTSSSVVPDSGSQSNSPAVSGAPDDVNQTNWTRLIEMRRQALDQEGSGDLKGASATYEQMVKLAQGTPNPSEAIKSQLATAQSAWDALRQRLAAATPVASPVPVIKTVPAPAGMTETVAAPTPRLRRLLNPAAIGSSSMPLSSGNFSSRARQNLRQTIRFMPL